MAYIAAVTAHPAFCDRFEDDLRTPGIRVPLTANPDTWASAVDIGRRVLRLHTRGQRFNPDGQAPRAGDDVRPLLQVPIPDSPLPDDLTYDPQTRELHVGDGVIAPVDPRVVNYEVSGMNVLRKWFGYRRATRPQARGEQSPLDDIRPTSWPPEYTSDLLDLLNVLTLLVEIEPEQADLLEDVMSGPRITVDDLTDAGVLPVPEPARSLPRTGKEDPAQQLWLTENDSRNARRVSPSR